MAALFSCATISAAIGAANDAAKWSVIRDSRTANAVDLGQITDAAHIDSGSRQRRRSAEAAAYIIDSCYAHARYI